HSFHSRWGRIFIFLSILFCSVAKGQLVADFSLNSRQGCASFIVPGFTNLSSGNQLTYLWDFGNGVTSTDANPRAVIYATDGSFTVKLTVTDAGGKKDSAVKKNFITVYKNPTVDFVVSNKAGCVPLGVQFTDMSTAGTSVNSKWEWDFGDGQTSLDKSPSHVFKVAGSFTITLKVTNSQGCLDVNTKTSLINVNERPKASFTSTSASSCNPPVVVSYTNTSTTAGVKSIKWDFGDGSVSFEQNPSHNFSKAGTYPVILAITSDNGCTDSISKPTVIGSVPSSITAPDNICEGASTKFINASTPAIASNFWDFGDGTNSIDTTPSKTFAKAGLYLVKLVNNFGGCKDSVTKKISVLPKPVADFSFIAPPPGCTLPVNVSFSSQATGATSYSWNFGDSTTSTSSQPTHSYAAYGTFSVQLKVTAANGCSDTITKKNVVSIVRVRINKLDNLPFAGCSPYQSTFSANITSPNPITSYTWNFGDGQTSPLANPVHNYTSLGSYDVSLKIATANGCTDSLQMKGAIVLSDKPKANFSASPLNACASDSVTFTNLSSGTITSTRWEFGDNTTSVVASPIHHYIDTGYFTVKLLVSNSSCNDSLTMNNYIYVKPPIASFSVLFDCAAPLTRKFRNKSVLAQTFEWSFGDGSAISAEENPEHTYKAGGIYFVRLRVTNGGCFNVYTDTIEVINEIPDFTISSNMVCRNTTMVFSAKNVNNSNIATYSWNFGDSSTIVTGPNPSVNHNYLIAGTYSPALTITDRLGCVQRVQKPANVTVYGPIANFTNPEGTCLNRAVIFPDSSRPTGNHPITYWILNYGDGKNDSST
ncbi:MAG: PKD domain-containing protein, partial [Segetibacter sp.]